MVQQDATVAAVPRGQSSTKDPRESQSSNISNGFGMQKVSQDSQQSRQPTDRIGGLLDNPILVASDVEDHDVVALADRRRVLLDDVPRAHDVSSVVAVPQEDDSAQVPQNTAVSLDLGDAVKFDLVKRRFVANALGGSSLRAGGETMMGRDTINLEGLAVGAMFLVFGIVFSVVKRFRIRSKHSIKAEEQEIYLLMEE